MIIMNDVYYFSRELTNYVGKHTKDAIAELNDFTKASSYSEIPMLKLKNIVMTTILKSNLI